MATEKKVWRVVSGEGTGEGTMEIKHATETGIKRILTKERCGGDRWATATDITEAYNRHMCR